MFSEEGLHGLLRLGPGGCCRGGGDRGQAVGGGKAGGHVVQIEGVRRCGSCMRSYFKKGTASF